MRKFIEKIFGLWKKETPKPVIARRVVDTDAIRARLKALSWKVLEIPVKRNHPDPAERKVVRWKLVATKGEKSMEVTGPNIDDAFKQLGMTLGVIAKT